MAPQLFRNDNIGAICGLALAHELTLRGYALDQTTGDVDLSKAIRRIWAGVLNEITGNFALVDQLWEGKMPRSLVHQMANVHAQSAVGSLKKYPVLPHAQFVHDVVHGVIETARANNVTDVIAEAVHPWASSLLPGGVSISPDSEGYKQKVSACIRRVYNNCRTFNQAANS